MPELSQQQDEFLQMADEQGVTESTFGQYVPQIEFEEEMNEERKHLPTIAYLHTGGTLMMVPSQSADGALSFEGATDIKKAIEICNVVAGIRNRYNIIGINLCSLDSKDVGPELWSAITGTLQTMYPRIDGSVVGHGTNTVQHSAAAMSFAIKDIAIPNVFASSQIPLVGAPGTDAFANLTGAMEIAAHGDFAETVAYADGFIHRGTRVIKKDDHRFQLLESPVIGPIGEFTAGGIRRALGARPRGARQKYETQFLPQFSESVQEINVNPSMNYGLLNRVVEDSKNVGIILQTYGAGAVPEKSINTLTQHIRDGFPMFLSSMCGASGVSLQDHDEAAIQLRELGINNVRDMLTTTASIKLAHIMANMPHIDDPHERLQAVTREMIERSYAGEITLPEGEKADF